MIKRGALLLLALLLFPLSAAKAEENDFAGMFVAIGEAIMAAKAEDWQGAAGAVERFDAQWAAQPKTDHKEFTAVDEALRKTKAALEARNKEELAAQLSALSSALLAYDKLIHPVDEAALRQQFGSSMLPAMKSMQEVIRQQDADALSTAYKKIQAAWMKKESLVREISIGTYGQIETKMGLLRIAISKEEKDFAQIETQFAQLNELITAFIEGREVAAANTGEYSVSTLVSLLDESVAAIDEGNPGAAAAKLEQFLMVWPSVEGDVSTKSGSLYNALESNIPIIAGKLSSQNPDLDGLKRQLEGYAQSLSSLQQKNYTAWDSASVLLREGLEALLIVSALLAFLKKTGHQRYQKWIWLGATAGILASVVVAFVITSIFEAAAAGTNREILEGITGIAAVLMMIGVGIWLHRKSHLQGWNQYINRQLGSALASGSVFAMAFVSFLSVFREGAETIIFYAGMISSIAVETLLLGIGIALVTLAVFAFLFIRYSTKIPLSPFFKVATILIYLLAFKILGVSIHALQLTGVVSLTVADFVPSIDFLGLYPTWETLISQIVLVLIAILAAVAIEQRRKRDLAV